MQYYDDGLGEFATWEEVYVAKGLSRIAPPASPQLEDDGLESAEIESGRPIDEWMNRAGQGPNDAVRATELGCRDIDLQHNWHSSDTEYGEAHLLKGFLASSKESHVVAEEIPVNSHKLNDKQLQVKVMNYLFGQSN